MELFLSNAACLWYTLPQKRQCRLEGGRCKLCNLPIATSPSAFPPFLAFPGGALGDAHASLVSPPPPARPQVLQRASLPDRGKESPPRLRLLVVLSSPLSAITVPAQPESARVYRRVKARSFRFVSFAHKLNVPNAFRCRNFHQQSDVSATR